MANAYRSKSSYRGRPGRPRTSFAPPSAPGPLSGQQTLKAVITTPEIPTQLCDVTTARITGCEYIASYNLLDKGCKTILVPGLPPHWSPISGDVVLSEDSGDFYRDENAARCPEHAMEFAVRTILDMKPDFPASSIDVFACASTLGNLLRFTRGKNKPFSFVAHLVGDTVFFLRREHSATQLIENIRGYGQAFLENYTSWEAGMTGSSSHQRIVQYNFGGKRLLVRYEVDAYLQHETDEDTWQTSKASVHADAPASQEEDALEDIFSKIKVSRGSESLPDPAGHVRVSRAGHAVPQHALADIKTRVYWRKEAEVLDDEIPRLWVRQIPWLALAFHTHGVFKDVSVKDVSDTWRKWETDNVVDVHRLAAVIEQIVQCARDTEAGKIEVRGSADSLELRDLSDLAKGTWDALPDDLVKLWK